jgi:hypothetical protein
MASRKPDMPVGGQRAWVLMASGRDGRSTTVTYDLVHGWISREQFVSIALKELLDNPSFGTGWVNRYKSDRVM